MHIYIYIYIYIYARVHACPVPSFVSNALQAYVGPPGSSVDRILLARMPEWAVMPCSR